MRKVTNITGILPRKGEPAGFADFDPNDADKPDGGTLVEIEVDGEATQVYRVSWEAKPRLPVLHGTVVSDAKRKPVRKGSVTVPQSRLGLMADAANLTDDERKAWLGRWGTDVPAVVPSATAALLESAGRKIIAAMIGSTFYIEESTGSAAILAF